MKAKLYCTVKEEKYFFNSHSLPGFQGSPTQDFQLKVFFMNPGPGVGCGGRFDFYENSRRYSKLTFVNDTGDKWNNF